MPTREATRLWLLILQVPYRSVTVAATTDGHLSLEKQQTSPASVPRTPTPCDQTGMGAANNTRFRLNRGGNRQTNAALHRIAITQMRIHPDAQAFIKRRLETGSTKREAIRLLNASSPTSSTGTSSDTPTSPTPTSRLT